MPAALTIAGSDPSGGAGIQADLKVFQQFGVYGEAVITLITVQNTCGVQRVHVLDGRLVAEQIRAVVEDIPPAAAKTGALGSAEVIEAVGAQACACNFPLVVDPVLASKGGIELMPAVSLELFKRVLLPRASLLTPNLEEASILTGRKVTNVAEMRCAAQALGDLGAGSVLVKGGHLQGDRALDILLHAGEWFEFDAPRIAASHTHGTGCTYSAAITAGLAQGLSVPEAVRQAKRYIQAAIQTNPGLGHGCGPVNHAAEW